jgi:hypothetical protein
VLSLVFSTRKRFVPQQCTEVENADDKAYVKEKTEKEKNIGLSAPTGGQGAVYLPRN